MTSTALRLEEHSRAPLLDAGTALPKMYPRVRLTMAANINQINITSVLQETRVFPPPKEFAKHAHIGSLAHYRKLYQESIRTPEKFWGKQAKQELIWFKQWKKVLQWKEPNAKWF